jgi:hypothetical protein
MNRHAIHLQRPDILPSESFRPSTQHIQLYGHQLARLTSPGYILQAKHFFIWSCLKVLHILYASQHAWVRLVSPR